MTLKKVYCYQREKNVLINTNNITYIELYLSIYIVHLSSGDEFHISKKDYNHIIGATK